MSGLGWIGVSHRTASVEVREQLSLDREGRDAVSGMLRGITGVTETCVLSTCNRTEIYVGLSDPTSPWARSASAWLLDRADRAGTAVDVNVLRTRDGMDVARHAFAVAAGLDSLVLGETQILAQLRRAFEEAEQRETVGPLLRRLFPNAFRAAKAAHTETRISAGAASVGSIAVDLAAKVFDDLHRRTALLIGAGETGATIARALHERKIGRLLISGRGHERAAALAAQLDASAVPADELARWFPEVDVLLLAARPIGGEYVIGPDHPGLQQRGRPLLAVDVGVPRNIDPALADRTNIFLYDLDDLEAVSLETRRRRQAEVPKVERILGRSIAAFEQWWTSHRDVGPLVRALHAQAGEVLKAELDRTLSKLPTEHHAAVIRLGQSLVSKLLQHPTVELRRGAAGFLERAQLIRQLFGLPPDGTGDGGLEPQDGTGAPIGLDP